MGTFDGSTAVFECAECGNVGLGDNGIRCCGASMERVDVTTDAVSRPTLDDLLGTVFDMSATELELCLCVMERGELTVSQLAEQTDYDRSVVTRHLNHLADLDVVRKERRLLEQGGEVYLYTPVAPEAIRRTFTRLFLAWVRHAARLLAELRREKVESIVDRRVDDPQWQIFLRQSDSPDD
jgi:predicted transcriptional regulator